MQPLAALSNGVEVKKACTDSADLCHHNYEGQFTTCTSNNNEVLRANHRAPENDPFEFSRWEDDGGALPKEDVHGE